ncbi:ATP-binding cassette domain-containing protein [uncultured Microbacterium sp.]|uniref:ATP-binding cassette domain-containing protein n=1 Tax=uncultured Microbacterium sp. TaxID=191216 RepID=UPI0028DC9D70|nr:ATP-binding cassette domain-containing protein [uncultured Microbacterium sp.]
MPDRQVLEFTRVTKRFNEVTAVSDFSARIEPGAVTAFLGPNGAGKTTTLRMLLGQVRPTSGIATIGGAAYADLRQPLRVIGSVLEETAYRPRRTATRQLTIAAKANDIPLARVSEVLSLVGLENDADARIGGFSLGMRQRLSVAHALLGDPGALVFDEPANGLDPEGIRWMRLLMRRLADEGRTVLVSSHVLSEVEQVADHVLVLSKGRLVLSSGIEELADPSGGAVVVDAADRAALTEALAAAGFDIEVLRSGLTVRGTDARRVGEVAADAGIALTTLLQRGPTLEDVFIQLTRGGLLEPRVEALAAASALAAPAIAEAVAEESTAVADEPEVEADSSEASEESVPPAVTPASEDASGVTDASNDADEAPADATASDDAADDDAADADASATASAIAADVATAAPGGPVSAGVVAAGAGTAIAAGAGLRRGNSASGASTDTDVSPAPSTDGQGDGHRSFDDILFGSAAPESEEPSTFPRSADHATDAHDAPVDGDGDVASADDAASDETSVADSASDDGADAPADDALASDADTDTDTGALGVEVFDGLDAETGAFPALDDHDATEDSAADASGEAGAPATDDDDPRAAAVSSMLADAARTYFHDEPRDYPYASPSDASDEATDDDEPGASAANAPLATDPSLADGDDDDDVRTRVIEIVETVPLSASDDEAANADEHDDVAAAAEGSSTDEHHGHESEHHEGDHDHGHEGEHHDGEHHDDHPHGHDGEHHGHEGDHPHEGEHAHHDDQHHDDQHHG